MVRLTHHELLQCRAPEPRREGHPGDLELDRIARETLKRQRGYLESREGIRADDPALVRLQIQLRAERDVARYLMVPYSRDPRVERRDRVRTGQGVPVEVICRKRKVDPKGRASMPELLLPVERHPVPGLAIVFVVWVDDGCVPHLAGWIWEDELRQTPSVFVGSRVFKRRSVSKLHEMPRLVTASPYVPVRQTVMGREEVVR